MTRFEGITEGHAGRSLASAFGVAPLRYAPLAFATMEDHNAMHRFDLIAASFAPA
jgi:hypothetical protein